MQKRDNWSSPRSSKGRRKNASTECAKKTILTAATMGQTATCSRLSQAFDDAHAGDGSNLAIHLLATSW